MKADPFAQLKLLDVQELDSKLDVLRHRLSSMPEVADLRALREQRSAVENELRDARILVGDLETEQKHADADVEQVKARRERDRNRIDSGQLTNPKDIERMQHELVSLERRIGTLEDTELEVMQRLEDAQSRLTGLEQQAAELDEKAAGLESSRATRAGELEEEAKGLRSDRETAAAGLPEDLVALYGRMREKHGGVGAAELRARQCGGCRLTLDNAELSKIRTTPTDQVIRCEECQRILVRTSESGL